MFERAWSSGPPTVIAVLIVAHAAAAAAQPSPDGLLTGTVRDGTGGVIAGATVAVESPSLVGGARTTKTGSDGRWWCPALPSGVYAVDVSMPRFRSVRRPAISLAAGQTLTIDVALDVAGVSESQHVEAPTPVVDVGTAAVSVNLHARQLLDLPTSLQFADLINLVPGISGDMAYGGTKLSNGIYVDGVDTTEPAEQGPWLRYNQNWLGEVQVVGLGADAEHGKFTGVNAYAIVRSGANRYSGLAEFWTTQSGWLAENTQGLSETLQGAFAPERIESLWDVNGQLGGPLRTDRLWFFTGYEYRADKRAPAGYEGPTLKEEREGRAIGKVTGALQNGLRLEGFIQGGRRRIHHQGIGPLVSAEATTFVQHPQVSWSTRALKELGTSVLLDIRYTGYDSPRRFDPMPPGTVDGPPGHFDLLTGARSVNTLSVSRDDRRRHNISGVGSWFGTSGFARNHELKVGIEADWARERTSFAYPGGMVYWDFGSAPNLRDLFAGSVATGSTRHMALFAQDRWRLLERLTLLPGIRVDLFRGSTSQSDDVFETTPVSPRVGLAWDVFGDHRTVVRVHYGRYTDQVFAQPILLTDYGTPGLIVTERIDDTGAWQEVSRRSLAGLRRIDSDLDHPGMNQVIAGAERQVGRDLSVQAQYIFRAFGDFLFFSPEGAVWAPVERRDPGADGRADTPDDGPILTVYNLTNPTGVAEVYTNPDDAWRHYNAVQTVVRKRESAGWQMEASYTWSRTTGTIGTAFHTNSGGRSTFGNPNRLINGDGRSPSDPTNQIKLLGSWRAPWFGGFMVSGIYRYMTGAAWGREFIATGLGQGNESILAEPRGTRRVDAINNLDLRAEKAIPLGANRQVGIIADVFNVTNQGVPDSDWVVPVSTLSGPSLGLPVVWRSARQLRLMARVTF
jgi:hypothetical protein